MLYTTDQVRAFVRESNLIEGIDREPTKEEADATATFLALPKLTIEAVLTLQMVYAPGKPLRTERGMNVRVGNYIAPSGGARIAKYLDSILLDMNYQTGAAAPFEQHVAFEKLHPFMDGNGRTGRALWAWQMIQHGINPFSLPFLHRFYYQTLAAAA